MGWLRDIFTGCDYRLTFHDGVRKVRCADKLRGNGPLL